uniref:ZP domain-containing protein n=1 Tax=Phallusia mammillata TaxID=59560 RepID=A0A6F9DYH6_9ASCI|nr:ZP domain-containing protein [Phallusia mammillata]
MSQGLLKLALFVCSISFLHKVSDARCDVGLAISSRLTEYIPAICDTWTISFVSRDDFPRLVAYFPSGELATNNFCQIYEGIDNSGTLAGTLLGGGLSFPVIVESSSVYVSCVLNLTTVEIEVFIDPAEECGEDVDSLPYNLLSPMFPGDYSAFAGCVWRFQLQSSSSLMFQFSTYNIEDGFDFLYFQNEEGNVERLTGNHTGGLNHTVTATILTLIFVSDASGQAQGFNATVNNESGMEQSMSVCRTKDLTIAVTADEQNTLDYEHGDTLYIALDRQTPLSQLNDNCKVTGSDPVFVFDIGQCEGLYQNENGKVSVSFLIWRFLAPSPAVIQRDVQNRLNVTCLFDSELLLSSSNVQSQAGSIETSAENTGNFDVALNLFSNQYFNESFPGEVTVPNYIFAEVKLDEISASNDDFIVQLEECWATRVENSSGLPNYPVVVSGCVAPPSGSEVAGAKMLIRNYESNSATFKLKSFVWTNFTDAEQFIYIHCDVTVCQNSTGECPGQTCGGKKRRSVDNNGRSQRLSAGPVRIVKTTKYLLVQDTPGDRDEAIEAADNIFQIVMFVLLAAAVMGAGYLVWSKITLNPTAKQIRL